VNCEELRLLVKQYDDEEKVYSDFDMLSSTLNGKTFLTKEDLLKIVKWKMARLWAKRHLKEIEKNLDSKIIEVTGKALKVSDDKSRIELLTEIHQVGVPLASTILSMLDPKKYAVVDINGWYALYGKEKKSFSANDFAVYNAKVRELCSRCSMTAREIDKALFMKGKIERTNNRRNSKK
jgi:hypothetical protein